MLLVVHDPVNKSVPLSCKVANDPVVGFLKLFMVKSSLVENTYLGYQMLYTHKDACSMLVCRWTMNIHCVELLIWSKLLTSFCTEELSLLLLDNSDYSWISSLQDTGSNINKIWILSTSYTLQCMSFDSPASSFIIFRCVLISQIKWIGRRHWREYSKYIHIFQLLLENWYLLCSQCASLPWKKEFQFVANLTAETFWPIVGIDSKLRKGSKKVLSSVKLFKTLTGFWRPG